MKQNFDSIEKLKSIGKVAEELLSSEMIEIKGGLASAGDDSPGCSSCQFACQNGCMICKTTLGI